MPPPLLLSHDVLEKVTLYFAPRKTRRRLMDSYLDVKRAQNIDPHFYILGLISVDFSRARRDTIFKKAKMQKCVEMWHKNYVQNCVSTKQVRDLRNLITYLQDTSDSRLSLRHCTSLSVFNKSVEWGVNVYRDADWLNTIFSSVADNYSPFYDLSNCIHVTLFWHDDLENRLNRMIDRKPGESLIDVDESIVNRLYHDGVLDSDHVSIFRETRNIRSLEKNLKLHKKRHREIFFTNVWFLCSMQTWQFIESKFIYTWYALIIASPHCV